MQLGDRNLQGSYSKTLVVFGDVYCEQVLLENGSQQQNLWGAGYMPLTGSVTYDSLINIRPRQNRSMEILDVNIREKIAQIVTELLGKT